MSELVEGMAIMIVKYINYILTRLSRRGLLERRMLWRQREDGGGLRTEKPKTCS